MMRYLIGVFAGGLFGYFVLYKLIGCSTGSCPLTANPIISTVIGILFGVLVAFAIAAPAKPAAENDANAGGAQSITAFANSAEDSTGIQSTVITYQKITPQRAKIRMESGEEVIVLDVRTQTEYDAEHIPGAILVPNETIIDQKPELLPDFDAEILVYCRSGNRSAQAANKLIAMGYSNVFDFGGIGAWPYETVTGAQ